MNSCAYRSYFLIKCKRHKYNQITHISDDQFEFQQVELNKGRSLSHISFFISLKLKLKIF